MSTTQQILWGYLAVGVFDALLFLGGVWAVEKFGSPQAKAMLYESQKKTPLELVAVLMIPLWPLSFVAAFQVLRGKK